MANGHEHPYIFNHSVGTLTVYAKSPRDAKRKAKGIMGDYHHVPAFVAKVKELNA